MLSELYSLAEVNFFHQTFRQWDFQPAGKAICSPNADV